MVDYCAGERGRSFPQTAPTTRGSRPIIPVAYGAQLNQKAFGRVSLGMLSVVSMLLVACATPPAKDFKGSWRPLNQFRPAATEIPLHSQYTFFAAPVDETLKSMLIRWATDTDRVLRYELNYDVTLYQPVAAIRTTDLDAAAAELNAIYAAQGVRVIAKSGEILVQSSNRQAPRPPRASSNDATPGVARP